MTPDLIGTYLMGAGVIACALFASINAVLMDPDRPNYPTGSWRLRFIMWAMVVVLGTRGADIISRAGTTGQTQDWLAQVSVIVMAAYFAARLEDHARKWLTPRQQAWVARMWEIASCRRTQALRKARQQANRALRPGVPRADTDPAAATVALVALAESGAFINGQPGDGGLIERKKR